MVGFVDPFPCDFFPFITFICSKRQFRAMLRSTSWMFDRQIISKSQRMIRSRSRVMQIHKTWRLAMHYGNCRIWHFHPSFMAEFDHAYVSWLGSQALQCFGCRWFAVQLTFRSTPKIPRTISTGSASKTCTTLWMLPVHFWHIAHVCLKVFRPRSL